MSFLTRYLRYLHPHFLRIGGSVLASLLFVTFSGLSYWLAADFVQALLREQLIVPPMPEGPIGPHNLIAVLKHLSASLLAADTPAATLRRAILFVVAAFLLKNIALYIQTLLSASVEQRVAKQMRDDLYQRLLQQDLAFFHRRRSGDLVSAAVNDINQLNAGLADSFSKLIRDPITAILFLLLLLAISWQMTLAALLIAPLTSGVVTLAGLSLKRKSKRTQERLSVVTSRLNDALYGIRIIQAYGGQPYEREKFTEATTNHFQQAIRKERLRRIISPLNEVVGIVVVAGILLIAGGRALGGEWISPDDFVRFLLLLMGMLNPIVSLSNVQGNLKVAEGAAQRVFDLMDEQHQIEQAPDAVNVKRFDREIRLENVSLNYAADREPAVRDLAVTITPGERVVLVGRSGSGKSTLLNLLPRFYDPTEGRISFDGMDLKRCDLCSLRSQFGIVTQEITLFNDTVAANISYNDPSVPRERIEAAARAAQAEDFILELPQGYDTNLGDLGDRLSGGQRQRISIARALLKDPPILLLDEPTSALDSDVAEEILQSLEVIGKGRTVLLATHRLSSIAGAKRILVFEKGRLVADGAHEDLLRESAIYAELCEREFMS